MNTSQSDAAESNTLRLAVLLLCLGFFVTTLFQTYLLINAHNNMIAIRANQETPLEEAKKIRQRAEDLAGRTATLAEQGNANAKLIVETFRRQGVDMKPPAK